MNLFSSIDVILNLSLIIGRLNADEEFDLLTADNVNISHIGFSGERNTSRIARQNKDFLVKITDDDINRKNDLRISAEGEKHRELYNEDDLYSFGISESTVRSAAALSFLEWPEEPIYYRRATPWGDLFGKFGFVVPQVNLIFDHINLLNFKETDEAVKTDRCENRSNKTIHCSAGLSVDVTNTISNTWSNSHTVNTGVSVGVDIVIAKAKLDFSYQYQWGESQTTSEALKITSVSSGDVQLKPGEAIQFTLMSRRGVWKAEIVYEAHLSGDILINYPNKHNGHYFYFPDLPYLLRFDNMDKCEEMGISREEMERRKKKYTETIEIKQIIELGFFTNSSLIASEIFRF